MRSKVVRSPPVTARRLVEVAYIKRCCPKAFVNGKQSFSLSFWENEQLLATLGNSKLWVAFPVESVDGIVDRSAVCDRTNGRARGLRAAVV
jgi:hypothetical protein